MIFTPEQIFHNMLRINPAILFEKLTNIDRKTYKSWVKNKRKPRGSSLDQAFKQINLAFYHEFGVNSGFNIEMFNSFEPGPPWKTYFEILNNSSLPNSIPETKKLTLLLEREGLKLYSFLKKNNFKKAAECYLSLDLKKLNFESDLIESCKKAKTYDEFFHYSMPFYIRSTMYCLASLDAEISISEEKITEQESQFSFILPILSNGIIISPRERWFQNLKASFNCSTWEELGMKIERKMEQKENKNEIDNFVKKHKRKPSVQEIDCIDNNEEYRNKIDKIKNRDFGRQLRRWVNGDINPKKINIAIILDVLFPEDNPYWHLKFYMSAMVFHFFYELLDEMTNKFNIYQAESEDIVEFFQQYNQYYKYFIEKYTAPVPQ